MVMLQDRLLFCRSTDVFCSSYTKPQVLSAQRKTPYPDFNITLAKNNSELKRPADVANIQIQESKRPATDGDSQTLNITQKFILTAL